MPSNLLSLQLTLRPARERRANAHHGRIARGIVIAKLTLPEHALPGSTLSCKCWLCNFHGVVRNGSYLSLLNMCRYLMLRTSSQDNAKGEQEKVIEQANLFAAVSDVPPDRSCFPQERAASRGESDPAKSCQSEQRLLFRASFPSSRAKSTQPRMLSKDSCTTALLSGSTRL